MSGLIFITTGAPTESLHSPSIWLIADEISISAVSMLAPSSYSSMTMETFSDDTDCTDFRSVVVANAASTGLVTVCSTCSGLAPTYVVYTTT